jgi:hypothetical protein
MVQRILWLILLGATVGPVLDHVHVATGTIRYPHPALWGQAWWVPLLYAGAALSIGLSHPAMDRLLGRRTTRGRSTVALVVGIAGMGAVWAGSGFLKDFPLMAGAVLAPAALALWWWLDGTWQGLVLAASTALGGAVVEYSLIQAGLFAYCMPFVGPVPSWLPWLYVSGSVAMGNVGRRIASTSPAAS